MRELALPATNCEVPVIKTLCHCEVFEGCQICRRKRKLTERKKLEKQDTGGRHGIASEQGQK